MPQQTLRLDELSALQGQPVYAKDGDQIGDLDIIYYDEATGEPEWLGVRIAQGGLLNEFFGRAKHVLVPIDGAEVEERAGQGQVIRVAYAKDQVKGSPDIEDDILSEETEEQLYAHYDIRQSETISETQLPAGTRREEVPPSPTDEVSVTRREEELQIGKRQVERGRARIRKWVETKERESVTLRPEEEIREEMVRDEVLREHVEVEGETEVLDMEEGTDEPRRDKEDEGRR